MSKVIPHGWKVVNLGSCMKLLTDFEANGSFATVKENVTVFDSENYAWYVRATDLEKNTPLNKVKYVDRKSYEFLSKTKLFGNEVLVTKRGEIGKVYYFKPVSIPATLAPNLYLLKLNDSVDSRFIFYIFASDKGRASLVEINASTTMGALYKDDVKKLKFEIPPLPEQQKIASILTAVDDVIESTQAQINKLKDLKTGMMQELLTKGIGHTEFKDSPVGRIPIGWDVKALGEVCRIQGGYAFKSIDASSNGCRWLKIANVGKGAVIWQDASYLPDEFQNRYKDFVLETDNIVVALTRPVLDGELKVALLRSCDAPALLNQRVARALPKVEVILNKFLYILFLWKKMADEIENAIFGTDPPNVSTKQIESIVFPIPPIGEQLAIANAISSVIERVESLSLKLESLMLTKKALMQDLLTGKVRVKVN